MLKERRPRAAAMRSILILAMLLMPVASAMPGEPADASIEISVSLLEDMPSNVYAYQEGEHVVIGWSTPASGKPGSYSIYANGNLLGVVGGDVNVFIDKEPSTGAYWVTATHGERESLPAITTSPLSAGSCVYIMIGQVPPVAISPRKCKEWVEDIIDDITVVST